MYPVVTEFGAWSSNSSHVPSSCWTGPPPPPVTSSLFHHTWWEWFYSPVLAGFLVLDSLTMPTHCSVQLTHNCLGPRTDLEGHLCQQVFCLLFPLESVDYLLRLWWSRRFLLYQVNSASLLAHLCKVVEDLALPTSLAISSLSTSLISTCIIRSSFKSPD